MNEERAVLAGGCFWGVQDLFRRYDGVLSTRVGYTGGSTPNATYRNHGSHAEGVEILFDRDRITFRQILVVASDGRQRGARPSPGSASFVVRH